MLILISITTRVRASTLIDSGVDTWTQRRGHETSRSYGEPVVGFSTEEAVQQALSVFRGEQPEYISPKLKDRQQRVWWTAISILLRPQVQNDPARVAELYSMVTGVRDLVHPAAKSHWEGLERRFELALREGGVAPIAPPSEWTGATRWGKKLSKTWKALEKAPYALLSAIEGPPTQEKDLLEKLQAALIDYLDVARQIRDARDKENK